MKHREPAVDTRARDQASAAARRGGAHQSWGPDHQSPTDDQALGYVLIASVVRQRL